jgi:DNA-binding IscR family transcriptional regulator
LKTVLGEAGAAFFEVLDRYSLEDLVKRKAEMKNLLEV